MSAIMRPYQQSAIAQVLTLWERGVDRTILVLPTGGGKSVCAKQLSAPFKNPLSVCHTRVLAEQLNKTVCRAATWQGLRQRQERGEGWPYGTPDLLVVDEVHVGDSPDWQHVFEMVPEGTKVLGLTATPWRFSHGTQQKGKSKEKDGQVLVGGQKNSKYGQGLGDLFGAMIVGVTPRELVRNGYLVPLKVMNVVEAQDAAARLLGKNGPSFKPGKDGKPGKHTGRVTANSDDRLDPVDAWLKYGEGRKTMVFCHLVPAAERTAARFQAMGVKASVVHGGLKAEECERRLAAFKNNELQVLVNVMQLTCGVDVPDVRCLIIDRGANNLNTYIQMCGRGARLSEGKTDCLILDLTGCSSVHGDPQKDQDYWVVTSEGRPVSELQCEVCGTRLSPMFPQRCMRCDPFRPKLGDPKELLDTGMRVYCALKDLRDAPGWTELTADEQDQRIELELGSFATTTELEETTRVGEANAARQRINDRIAAEKRRLADIEAAKLAAELAEKRLEAQRLWEAGVEARRAQALADAKKRAEERQRAAQARSEAIDAAQAKRHAETLERQAAQAWEPKDREAAERMLRAKFELYMQRGWSLSSAMRDVRQMLPRYASRFSRENYSVPESLLPLLSALNASQAQQTSIAYGRTLAAYELERMMGDARTNRYGEAWCRKKVRELFGFDCFSVKEPSIEARMSDGGRAQSLEELSEIPF